MSNLSIKTEQIVSNTGTLSIEVFKNFELPDNSKLHFNCHGQDTKSIFFNCPNGGITYDSLNYNITSDRINIKSRDNIQLKSYNKINIESLDVIEIGNYQSSILINSKESFLNLDFTERKESSINILSNNININNKKNYIILNKNLFKLQSDSVINFGNNYNNTLQVDCYNDKITINGDIYINGNIISKSLIKSTKIENIINNSNFIFNVINSPNKDWSITNNDKYKSGVFYDDQDKNILLKNNEEYLNLTIKSLSILDNNITQNIFNKDNYLSIERDSLYIDKNFNIHTEGTIYSNSLNINNNIICNDKGIIKVNEDIIIGNFHLSNLVKYTVGNNCSFLNIQDCIDYIELNNMNIEDIFIEIYSNKQYIENIKISKRNINLVGKNKTVKIFGSILVDYSNCDLNKNFKLLVENLEIETNLCKNNTFILQKSSIEFSNTNILLKDESSINILDSNKVKIRNSKIIGGSTKCLTKIVGEEILFYNSKIDMNMNIEVNLLNIDNCYSILTKKIWKIKTLNIIKVLNSQIQIESMDLKNVADLNKNLYKSNNMILINTLIDINKKNIFYPNLVLNPNYTI